MTFGVMLHLGKDAPPEIDGPKIFDMSLGVERAVTQEDVDALLEMQGKYFAMVRAGRLLEEQKKFWAMIEKAKREPLTGQSAAITDTLRTHGAV